MCQSHNKAAGARSRTYLQPLWRRAQLSRRARRSSVMAVADVHSNRAELRGSVLRHSACRLHLCSALNTTTSLKRAGGRQGVCKARRL